MAKTFIVMRHGDYLRSNRHLSDYGVEQVKDVSKKLSRDFHVGRICCSSAIRAEQTGIILKQAFDLVSPKGSEVAFEKLTWLTEDSLYRGEVAKLSYPEDVVVIVAHAPYIEGMSSSFGEKLSVPNAGGIIYTAENWGAFTELPKLKMFRPEV